MSKDETVTEQYDRDDNHFQFAEANAPIDYEPYRQSYKLPEWKDTKGRYAKRPSRDLGTDRNTDKSVYHSRDIMEQEWERIWSKVWLLVGHLNDIPKPNAFMKVDRAHESVLIVRGEGDSIRAMYNVCQHRGARLVEQDFGTTKKFVCPFHMWEFSSNGELLKITDRETFREEALCHNLDLPEVRSAVYRGWIFITFNDDAGPLEEYLGSEFLKLTEAYSFENVLRIRDSKLLMFQAPRDAVAEVLRLLPDAEPPTSFPVDGSELLAMQALCHGVVTWQRLEELKRAGACGLMVLPVERMLA